MLYALRAGIVTGIPAGVFFYWFRGRFGSVEVLGVNALGFAFNLLGANLRHSHVYLSYGRTLERWLISPAQHQIHHGRAARHHDRNFGSFLALWDRLAGTLSLAEGREAHERMRVGLSADERNHGHTLVSGLIGPARAALWSAAERARVRRRRAPDAGRRAVVVARVSSREGSGETGGRARARAWR
jgi:hypothetical protein